MDMTTKPCTLAQPCTLAKPCGLIGGKLGHSYSPVIHAELGDYEYRLWELEEEQVGTFVRSDAYRAMNVTIPYKKTVMPFLDIITPEAERIGAVNTITRTPDGKLRGDNTDYYGFLQMLRGLHLTLTGKKVMILGAGGASATAQAVTMDQGAAEMRVIAHADNTPETMAKYTDTQVLINCTPVGMYPKNGVSPVSLDYFPHLEGVLDMIYNPAKTRLLLDAQERGIPSINGLVMLVAQAKRASELFFDTTIDDSVIPAITDKIDRSSRNIVLIGMPGCGKSTLGKALAELTGRPFADTDDMIVARAGRSIPDIFAEDGEKCFLQIERDCVAGICAEHGMVIATGGGAPVQPGNGDLLRQNSLVLYLRRDLSALPTDGRPLSQSGKLAEMEKVRGPIYRQICDAEIVVDDDIAVTLARAKEALGI